MNTNNDLSNPSNEGVEEPNFNNLDPDVKEYINNLKAKNLQLHRKINKLRVEILSYRNKIKADEEIISELSKRAGEVHIYLPDNRRDEPVNNKD